MYKGFSKICIIAAVRKVNDKWVIGAWDIKTLIVIETRILILVWPSA